MSAYFVINRAIRTKETLIMVGDPPGFLASVDQMMAETRNYASRLVHLIQVARNEGCDPLMSRGLVVHRVAESFGLTAGEQAGLLALVAEMASMLADEVEAR